MERAEWLKAMRGMAEALYDHISPKYWNTFGLYENKAHQEYLRKFLQRMGRAGMILSAACGAGRYDGLLLEAGYGVVGIDQSQGMLVRARERFPQAQYRKMALQEMDFHQEFDGAICMDAMEHICPEDWPGIMERFHEALRPGGLLYFTSEIPDTQEVEESYERAKGMGLPVVIGELADGVQASYEQMKSQESAEDLADPAVYHYYPAWEQVRAWIAQAGMQLDEEGEGSGYRHFIAGNPG